MDNVKVGCLCGKHEFKKPTKEELDRLIEFLKEMAQEDFKDAQPYKPMLQPKTPCMFDNLPDGAYGLACPCPKHSATC